MKKYSIIIMAIALVLGLAQCKKQETPATPDTPDVEGNWVRITMRVGGGGREMDTLYPGTGAVIYEDGDIIYVGNNGKYRGKLEYHNGTFSGLVCDPEPTDYLHFYYLSELTPSNFSPLFQDKDSLVPNTTARFTVNIADQSGGLPVISYGHSTTMYTNETSAYTCMLMNKCGLVKFVTRPAPSTTNDAVTISGMKTTATIDFGEYQNPGITPTDVTGDVTPYKYNYYGADPGVRWAILLPQEETETTLSYTMQNGNDTIQTITLPKIKANSYYGGYNGITVGLEWVDLGLSSGRLWATCNVGSDSPEGFGTFFAWAETEPKSTYCWHSYKYAYNPVFYPRNPPAAWITAEGSGYSSDDTLHHEPGSNGKPNLGFFRYNTQQAFHSSYDQGPDRNTTIYVPGSVGIGFLADDDAAYVNWGKDWRIPTKQEWEELLNTSENLTRTWAVVNGVGGLKITSTTNGNSMFLPAAGVYGGPMHSFYYNCGNQPHGEYWSNEIDPAKPYQAYIFFFDGTYSGGQAFFPTGKVASELEYHHSNDSTDVVYFIRNQGRPVRAVYDPNIDY